MQKKITKNLFVTRNSIIFRVKKSRKISNRLTRLSHKSDDLVSPFDYYFFLNLDLRDYTTSSIIFKSSQVKLFNWNFCQRPRPSPYHSVTKIQAKSAHPHLVRNESTLQNEESNFSLQKLFKYTRGDPSAKKSELFGLLFQNQQKIRISFHIQIAHTANEFIAFR